MMSPVANHVTLGAAPSSGRASFPAQNDRERSRNAKAQARHRAKRKAYVEQLESTVARLQVALGVGSENPSVVNATQNRIRELEDENARLQDEVDELRRQLEMRNSQLLRPDIGRRTSAATDINCEYDDRNNNSWDFESKKHRLVQDSDREFALRPTGIANRATIPPPLHIPSITQPQYAPPQNPPSRSVYQHNGSIGYPIASPLSTSSSSSSPSFSPHHLSPIVSRPSGGGHHTLPSINDHYPVKVEDDSYLPTPTLMQSNQYSYPNEPVSVGSNPWHAYPTERHDIQQ